jgi:hypothetical protein
MVILPKGFQFLYNLLTKIIIFVCFITIEFILVYACNPFAPLEISDNDASVSNEYLYQKNPPDVLTKFRNAYTFKDSVMYIDILDSSFIFISKNYNTSPPSTIKWGRDVDIKTTIGLFRSFNIIELIWGDTLYYDIQETNAEINISFQLTIDGGREYPTITGEALFNFIKKSNQRWFITRWEDRSSF